MRKICKAQKENRAGFVRVGPDRADLRALPLMFLPGLRVGFVTSGSRAGTRGRSEYQTGNKKNKMCQLSI